MVQLSYRAVLDLIPIKARPLWVISPILASIVLTVFLASVSLDMLSAARAFVGGESLWAKGQKEAVSFLNRYARTHDEEDFRRFETSIAVPLGDRKARLELLKPDPDLELAREGFLEGRNHPDDIDGMIRLFRRFGNVSFMAKAIQLWTDADRFIVELSEVATQLRDQVLAGSDPRSLQPLINRINAINRQLTPMEEEFSATLGEASRKTELLLLAALMGSSIVLSAFAIKLSHGMHGRHEAIEEALRKSEERLSLAIKANNDGIWDWNLLDGKAYYSARVAQMLGYAPELLRPDIRSFRTLLHRDDIPAVRHALDAHLRESVPFDIEFRLRTSQGPYRWFRAHGEAVRDSAGRATRMAGSIADINDRRLAEAAFNRHALQQGLIAAFGQMALENPAIDDLMASTVAIVQQGLDVEFCRLLASCEDDRTLILKGGAGWDSNWSSREHYDAEEETGHRFVIGSRHAVIIDDFFTETRFEPSACLLAHGVRSGVEILIRGTSGAYAVLGVYSRQPSRYSKENLDFLNSIAHVLASAMDRKLAEERLTYLAQFDTLTGLPRRNTFVERLSQTIDRATNETTLGVLFVDLDRFKLVNDTLGHGAGDEVLLQTARRLQECVRPGDIVGRLGGDEFAVALARLGSAEEAGAIARRIVASLSAPLVCEGQEVRISASVGISIFPDDGRDPDTLIRNADTAMYRAKESGRNRFEFHVSAMNRTGSDRLRREDLLRGALERGEFALRYQPRASLAGAGIVGLEALLRWQSPDAGLVAPAGFLSILKDTGLILPVGRWVVTTVCAQLLQWQAQGLQLRPVAINLSAQELVENHLETVMEDVLSHGKVKPGLIEFEIAESTLMADPAASIRTLERLKSQGVGLAIDDFGTGFSNLAELNRFGLDALKIDRSLVEGIPYDPRAAGTVDAIIRLARGMHLNVIAEGVENDTQRTFLQAHACDEMQGYLFARPLSPTQCALALRQERPKPVSPLRLLKHNRVV